MPRTRLWIAIAGALAIVALAATAGGASGASLFYHGFESTEGLKLNGSAETSGRALRLTYDYGQEGSAFTERRVVNPKRSFSSKFRARVHGGGAQPADGLAFVVQRGAAGALGLGGSGVGYEGIGDSVAVALDTYPGPSYIFVYKDGDVDSPLAERRAPFGFAGPRFNAWIDYKAGKRKLLVFVSRKAKKPGKPRLRANVNLQRVLGGPARAGFTAGTGGEYSVHDILSWKLRN